MDLKQKADAAKAEQLRNMADAASPLDAYWAGSACESVRLHYKHGAVRTVRAGAATRRRTNAALKAITGGTRASKD